MAGGLEYLIELPKEQIVEALAIADYLTTHRKKGTFGQKKENAPKDNRTGIMAEFGARMAWRMEPWDRTTYPPFGARKMGDVGDAEIRGATWSTSPLNLQPGEDDVGASLERNFLLLIVSPEDQNYRMMIVGWRPMREVVTLWRDHSVEESYGHQRVTYKVLDQEHLYDPAALVITEKGIPYGLVAKRRLLLCR